MTKVSPGAKVNAIEITTETDALYADFVKRLKADYMLVPRKRQPIILLALTGLIIFATFISTAIGWLLAAINLAR